MSNSMSLPIGGETLLAAMVDESLTRAGDGLHVQQTVLAEIAEAGCASALDLSHLSLRYAFEGRGLHAYLADCAARVVERIEEEAGTPVPAPVEFVACVNANGEGEIVVVPSVPWDDEDGDILQSRLRSEGYAGPFVFLGPRLKGPFTPCATEPVTTLQGQRLTDARYAAAQAAFEAFDFGDPVGETSGWERTVTDGAVEFSRPVFLESAGVPDAPSRKVTFVVGFAAGSAEVADQYAT